MQSYPYWYLHGEEDSGDKDSDRLPCEEELCEVDMEKIDDMIDMYRKSILTWQMELNTALMTPKSQIEMLKKRSSNCKMMLNNLYFLVVISIPSYFL